MKRRDFLKILGAGVAVTVIPEIGAVSQHTAKMTPLATKQGIEFLVDYGPRNYDPLGQLIVLAWKGWGSDGVQYGDCIQISESDFDSFKIYGRKAHSELVDQIREVPHLSHLRIPTWDSVIDKIIKAEAAA